ncbi:BaiN/RdsA family NAD(P)/FAD-dependent oxidoreductase [Hoeflea alexandrii]|uniref:Aminoacetone oxidase family FAD-binding enzyme n=1 Tax=Hoeflea alexandrii TaxID=288436 RepID=A0ABT1CTH1_9HYPH|nr:NAD(P)/FAD-dependent oxidoreductase [Hoeflea alexandrii]MCO6409495.1 aminoacetone oxidase family FAD-binding enzyme [Hoeflea alexandrii]MCY0152528.1 NAD(P)/FAD-dependent oxidoreductase [Hoeflea alexandrii]
MSAITKTDVVVLGAGAAGMMCAIEAGQRGRSVVVIDHAKAPGEKIRISGGGRCNFTNLHCTPKNFISNNPHFAISALKSFTQHDFIDRVKTRGIAFHEKTLGQLFCDGSAREIIAMLTSDMREAGARLELATDITKVTQVDGGFETRTSAGTWQSRSLVVATGGKSIPKMGATGLGYELARQFGHDVTETRAGLVPFTWASNMHESWGSLSGVALDVHASCNGTAFDEAMLFTHRGLSGPAMLQVSSYWREGDTVTIDLAPGLDLASHIKAGRTTRPKASVWTVLGDVLTKRLAQQLGSEADTTPPRLADLSNSAIEEIVAGIRNFGIVPGGTEGYRTAEVTLGGVDTNQLNQKTMESRLVPGLHFIGEVMDVTGHLGGHNFQWAWSSGAAAGRSV